MEKSASERQVRVHPLAIASICDHYTRVAMGGSLQRRDDPVVGLLFGTQTGLVVDIIDATDAIYTVSEEGQVQLDLLANFPDPLDPDNKNNKMDLVIAPFADMRLELLGWYTLNDTLEPQPWCLALHQCIKAVNEAPLLVLMNHSPQPGARQLPMAVFESERHDAPAVVEAAAAPVEDTATTAAEGAGVESFATLPFRLETSQTERIAVDQVTKQGPLTGSALELQNQALSTSLAILARKLGVIVAAVQRMRSGAVPTDHTLLRRANHICQQLPAVDSPAFDSTFRRDLADAVTASFLGAVTKTSSALGEVGELYSLLFNEKARSRDMDGGGTPGDMF